MSELTLTILRMALLVLLWLFVFSVAGVLRGDLYGTRVVTRTGRAGRGGRGRAAAGADRAAGAAGAAATGAPSASPAPAKAPGLFGDRKRRRGPTKLVVTSGPLSGTSLPLREAGTLIGRSPECALVLDDDYSSGRHARIFHDGSTWLVEDLRSTNGTYADSARVTDAVPVDVGSQIRIGRTVIELQR